MFTSFDGTVVSTMHSGVVLLTIMIRILDDNY